MKLTTTTSLSLVYIHKICNYSVSLDTHNKSALSHSWNRPCLFQVHTMCLVWNLGLRQENISSVCLQAILDQIL